MGESNTKLLLISIFSLIGTLCVLYRAGNFKRSEIYNTLGIGFLSFIWIDVVIFAGDILLFNTAGLIFGNYSITQNTPPILYTIVSAVLYFLLKDITGMLAHKIIAKTKLKGILM